MDTDLETLNTTPSVNTDLIYSLLSSTFKYEYNVISFHLNTDPISSPQNVDVKVQKKEEIKFNFTYFEKLLVMLLDLGGNTEQGQISYVPVPVPVDTNQIKKKDWMLALSTGAVMDYFPIFLLMI